jgi:hypothetical protein
MDSLITVAAPALAVSEISENATAVRVDQGAAGVPNARRTGRYWRGNKRPISGSGRVSLVDALRLQILNSRMTDPLFP